MAPPPRPPPPKKKQRGPIEVNEEVLVARQRGALLGLAVGDAFGVTNEFRKLNAPLFPETCDGVQTEIRGGGPFAVKRGQVTDDTQMACCLAGGLRSLLRFELIDTAREYRKWLPHAFDVGAQTKQAIELLNEGRSPENSGRTVWLESGKRAAGNGSLMRTAALGVFFCRPAHQHERITATLADSGITHFDPRCSLSCVVHNALIAAAIMSPKEQVERDELFKQAEADLSIAAAELAKGQPDFVLQVSDAAEWVREDIRLAQDNDPMLYGPEIHLLHHEGFVRVAFRLSLWELFHVPSYEKAIIDVANRGGDSDTNCAITGALFGAVFGEAGIPAEWKSTVLEALENSNGPLRTVYHPTQLLLLAGQKPVPLPNTPAR